MGDSYRVHFYHVIWSTKGRRNLILPKFKKELYSYINGIVLKQGANLIAIGGVENHLHLLLKISVPDKFTRIISSIKSYSSGWLKRNYIECLRFSWQDGYASFSVSHSQVPKVIDYISNQESHHRTKSYEQEFIRILDAHEIEYKKEYLFCSDAQSSLNDNLE